LIHEHYTIVAERDTANGLTKIAVFQKRYPEPEGRIICSLLASLGGVYPLRYLERASVGEGREHRARQGSRIRASPSPGARLR
jgi:hypothetical protein